MHTIGTHSQRPAVDRNIPEEAGKVGSIEWPVEHNPAQKDNWDSPVSLDRVDWVARGTAVTVRGLRIRCWLADCTEAAKMVAHTAG